MCLRLRVVENVLLVQYIPKRYEMVLKSVQNCLWILYIRLRELQAFQDLLTLGSIKVFKVETCIFLSFVSSSVATK